MCRRKTIPPLQKFWEEKLGVEYDKEFEYYKKLCGISCNENIICKNEKYYKFSLLQYDVWERSVLNDIEKLSVKELEEYSRFLNEKSRDNKLKFEMSQAFFIPYMIFVLGICTSLFNSIINYPRGNLIWMIVVIIACLIVFSLIIYGFNSLCSIKNELVREYFYKDMKEIIDKKIKTQ